MIKRRTRRLALFAALPLCAAAVQAQPPTLAPLSDAELGVVWGGILSFDFANFSVSGDARFTYYTPGDTASTWIGNIALSRSDPTVPFEDPYNLDILTRPGLPDYFNLTFPANSDGAAKWQYAYDWGTNADGIDFQGGAWVFKDVVYYGGGLQISTPNDVVGDGVAYGLALRQDIGDILLRPRGRADTADAESAAEQMHWRGLHVSAANPDGTPDLTRPWQIAHITHQPGIFNTTTDASGEPRLHLGIGWPTDPVNNPAPWGSIGIDNLSFKSDSLVRPSLDLGASRIGGIQIQYLDILFRP